MWIDNIEIGDLFLDVEDDVYFKVDCVASDNNYKYILYVTTISTTNRVHYVFFYLDDKWWHEKNQHTYQHNLVFYKKYNIHEDRNSKINSLIE